MHHSLHVGQSAVRQAVLDPVARAAVCAVPEMCLWAPCQYILECMPLLCFAGAHLSASYTPWIWPSVAERALSHQSIRQPSSWCAKR